MTDIIDGITALEERLTGPYEDIAAIMVLLCELHYYREARCELIREIEKASNEVAVDFTSGVESGLSRALLILCPPAPPESEATK